MTLGISGDTRIAVADGRNFVKIEKLVGSVVPVYCFNGNTIDICWSDTIRKVGRKEIFETVLDDETSVFTTKYQEFMLRDGTYCKFENLVHNNGLMPLNKRTHNEGYILTNLNNGTTTREHRLFLACKLGRPLSPYPEEVTHHNNGNVQDNRWKNLEAMGVSEHHRLHKIGKKYPKRNANAARKALRSMSLEDRKKMGHTSYRGKILFQAKWMRDNEYSINLICWNSHREKFCQETDRKAYYFKTAMKYFNTQEELIKVLDNNHKAIEFYHVGVEVVYSLYTNVGNFAILTSDMSGIILGSK